MTDGDRDAEFRRLFNQNYRLLLAYALRRTSTRADAEDVVSEAFVVAWRRPNSIPADEHEQKLWLYGVARRVLANQRRGDHRAERLSSRLKNEVETVPTPDDQMEDASDVTTALSALAMLSESDREMVTLALWEELSHRDISKVVGTPVANVSVRLHRAKSRLRTHFEQLVQGPPDAGHVHLRRATGDQEQESTG